MAYAPPHKRHSTDTQRCSPLKPELLKPLFNKNNLKFKSQRNNGVGYPRSFIFYSKTATSKWFAVGFVDDDDDRHKFPSSVSLQPVSFESEERKGDEKTLALIFNDQDASEKVKETVLRAPWVVIAENVVKDLLSSFGHVRSEMESCEGGEVVRPVLVARFGKIIFRRLRHSFGESVSEDLACEEDALKKLKRIFNSSVPKSYMEYIVNEGAHKIGVEFEDEKDFYHVKLSDSSRLDETIACKCRVSKEDGKLELYKIEQIDVRQMVTDISCIAKNVDLRLMLCTKRIMTSLTDDDLQSIQDLISWAVVDSRVQGGLLWPFGKSSCRNKFFVAGVSHSKTKSYVNASMRLKVRTADRFDFKTSTGVSSKEIMVKLKGIISELKDQQVDENAIKEMLKDELRVLWESFICCESFLKW